MRGKYDILGHIARGGMAELQLARATGIEGFEKLIVIKRILPHLATNREFVTMFLDEARIAATLHHPNIVQVYDIGSLDGDYFFTMEYLHGEDVRHVMKAARDAGRPIPLEHALSVVMGVCAALHHAHGAVGLDGDHRGIIHRDVSPQNVFVTFEGGVKLVDFGIAKAARRLTETREGTLKGKVQYMSPEQCIQSSLDPRSDVFAVGIMLWELTVGRQLFGQRSEFEILKAIVETDAPSPTSIDSAYPEALERIVLKALRRDREQRYQSAQALQADLEDFAREQRIAVSAIGLQRFMRTLFGDRVDALATARRGGERALVEHVMQAIDLRTSPSIAAPDTIADRGHADRRGVESTVRAATRTLEAPPGRSTRWMLVSLLVVAVVLAGTGLRLLRGRAQVTETPAVVVADPPQAARVEPEPIVIALRKDPVNATVTLDGRVIEEDWLRLPRDARPHELRVTAAGYLPHSRTVDATSERTLFVFLKRASTPAVAVTKAVSHKRRSPESKHAKDDVASPPVMPALDP